MTGKIVTMLLCVIGIGAAAGATLVDHWDHEVHRGLFPSCLSCHAGAVDSTRSLYPTEQSCVRCHDGEIEERVEWQAPGEDHRSNLAFDHGAHARAAGTTAERRSSLCTGCHSETGADWLAIKYAVVERCLDCHGIETAHTAAPDTTCATCHVTLAEAVELTEEDINAFTAPPSHSEPDFAQAHGPLAEVPGGISASCATCHAQEFCLQCHVDGPEQVSIASLARDPRSLVFRTETPRPASHDATEFESNHGDLVEDDGLACATCHTRESCQACHRGAIPNPVRALHPAGEGRAPGAAVARVLPVSHAGVFVDDHGGVAGAPNATCAGCHVREDCVSCHRTTIEVALEPAEPRSEAIARPALIGHGTEDGAPSTHDGGFVSNHDLEASASPESCAGCHVREDCLMCHRPSGVGGGYHGQAFFSAHAEASYARETSCADCHNTRQFCTTCHVQAGLTSIGPLGAGYHDAKQSFILGHGEAARQSLESCVACHIERDCLRCHSAFGGRRFSPHGPGFEPERMLEANPTTCMACHGANIPDDD